MQGHTENHSSLCVAGAQDWGRVREGVRSKAGVLVMAFIYRVVFMC